MLQTLSVFLSYIVSPHILQISPLIQMWALFSLILQTPTAPLPHLHLPPGGPRLPTGPGSDAPCRALLQDLHGRSCSVYGVGSKKSLLVKFQGVLSPAIPLHPRRQRSPPLMQTSQIWYCIVSVFFFRWILSEIQQSNRMSLKILCWISISLNPRSDRTLQLTPGSLCRLLHGHVPISLALGGRPLTLWLLMARVVHCLRQCCCPAVSYLKQKVCGHWKSCAACRCNNSCAFIFLLSRVELCSGHVTFGGLWLAGSLAFWTDTSWRSALMVLEFRIAYIYLHLSFFFSSVFTL